MRQQLMCSVAACAIITAMSGPVFAADQRMPVKAAPAPALYAPNWSGFYIGGHLGWGEAKFDASTEHGADTLGTGTPKPSGLVGGMHGGHNWQVNTFVYGWEADLSATGWNKRDPSGIANTTPKSIDSNVKLLASLRGRLGMTFDRTLFYVTGGLAYTQASFVGRSPEGTLSFSADFKKFGSVFGGGAEWKQNPNFSWRAEALYYIFNKSAAGGFGSSRTWDVKLKNALVVRLGATYHFDGGGLWGKGPVAARY